MLRTFTGIFVGFGLLLMASLYFSVIHSIAQRSLLDTDYGKFYNSSQLFFAGKNVYADIVNLKLIKPSEKIGKKIANFKHARLVNLSTPWIIMLMLPLGKLSYYNSFIAWNLLSILFGLLSVVFLWRAYSDRLRQNSFTLLMMIGAFFLYEPTLVNILTGQVTLFVFFLLVSGWFAIRTNKPFIGGIFLGLAFSSKLFIGLFLLLFLLRRDWMVLIGLIFASVLTTLMTSAFFGADVYWSYHNVLNEIDWYTSNWNVSLRGFFDRIFGTTIENNISIFFAPTLSKVCYYTAVSLLLLGLAFIVLLPIKVINSLKQFDLEFSYACVAMLLISPLGWTYYLPILLLPMMAIWYWSKESRYKNEYYLLLCIIIFLSGVPQDLLLPEQMIQPLFIWFWAGLAFYAQLILIGNIIYLHFFDQSMNAEQKEIKKPCWLGVLLIIISLAPSLIGVLKLSHGIKYSPRIFYQ